MRCAVKGRGGLLQRPATFTVILLISVVASLVFLADRLADFSATFGQKDFIDNISSVSFSTDSEELRALEQEPGAVLKKPVGVIYKDGINTSANIDGFPKEHSEITEEIQSEQKENEFKPAIFVLDHGDKRTERVANTASEGEDQLKSELRDTLSSQKISARESQKMRIERQNSQKIILDAHVRQMRDQKKIIPDAHVRQMRDQVIRAKAYLNLAPARNNAPIVRELRQRIRDVHRALGEAAKDTELSRRAPERMRSMESTLFKANKLFNDCSAMVKKLRAMMHSTEEQLRVHKKQGTFLTQLAARSFPKGLHCLPMRLTAEYYSLTPNEQEFPNKGKLDDPSLYHHAIFSDNILAAAVVVNSTVFHSKETEKVVFHLVTDKLNYAAMRMWFLANPPGNATIQVQNIDEFTWMNSSYSPILKQLESASRKEDYFKSHYLSPDGGSTNLRYRNPKYLNMFNHLRFYLPEVFPKLNKVLFLDDDVVVQKDLTALWGIDLHSKVNGAVETCGETFFRFDKYLNFSNPLIARDFDPNSCAWAYGMNIFDLQEWKKQDLTGIYHKWQSLNKDRQLWKLGSLPLGLITFYNLTYALDKSWHVLGLGYDPSVSRMDIAKAAVIHYSGNMKPWLEIGIAKYKQYWTKYVKYDHIFLQQCNLGE
jgi:alpha-1,4-galacturonosyltransferase